MELNKVGWKESENRDGRIRGVVKRASEKEEDEVRGNVLVSYHKSYELDPLPELLPSLERYQVIRACGSVSTAGTRDNCCISLGNGVAPCIHIM